MVRQVLSYIVMLSFVFALFVSSPTQAAVAVDSRKQSEINAKSGPGYALELKEKEVARLAEEAKLADEAKLKAKGTFIGRFKTTGYNDSTELKPQKTASGVLPKAEHTVAADWSVLPPGTKIRIGESPIVYTVEDKGSAVKGNTVDIFYANYSQALAHGVQYFDVYLIEQ